MSTGWTIRGEAGAALDEFDRPLRDLCPGGVRLSLNVLASDTLEWQVPIDDASAAGWIVPDIAQLVELHYDGVRRYRGHVTMPRVGLDSFSVMAEGPWWWMQRIALTSLQADGTGEEAERPQYVFPTQKLELSIASLIDRLIENGVPMQKGTISEAFAFPQITLAEQTGAQALSSMMAIIPDAVAYFDYSVNGLPALNVIRRGDMATQKLQVGLDSIESMSISPRLDLEVQAVDVQSVERRSTDGKTKWATQTVGTAIPGKTQVVVVSGPEVNEILPKDSENTFQLQTLNSSGAPNVAQLTTFIKANDPNLATIIRDFDYAFTVSSDQTYLVSQFSTGNATGAWGIVLDGPSIISNADATGYYVITSADRVPDWFTEENGYTMIQGTVTGWAYHSQQSTSVPDNWDEIIRRAVAAQVGYKIGVTSASDNYQYNAFFQFSVPVQLINTSFPTMTDIYRQWGYDYTVPPNDLGINLLAAQNWIPWEGQIVTAHDQLDGSPDFGRKVDVINAHPSNASMGALKRRIVYDIKRGRRTIDLGAPARVDFGSLASRFRSRRRDNIVYL